MNVQPWSGATGRALEIRGVGPVRCESRHSFPFESSRASPVAVDTGDIEQPVCSVQDNHVWSPASPKSRFP